MSLDPAPSAPPATLGPEHLARVFGIADLADRLAAVDECIADALGRDGAVLAPAATRVAATGGKRLRPLLTIVAAELGPRFDDRVAAAAAAVELVQVGSLVHDDILDRSPTRRGRPTINAVEGIDHAVLAGDFILARAGELAASVNRETAALVGRSTARRRRCSPAPAGSAPWRPTCPSATRSPSRSTATPSAWRSRCSTTSSTSSATPTASASRPASTSPAASTPCRSSRP